MLQKFQEFNRKNLLFNQGDKVLLAVSGGIDSVLMAHLFKAAKQGFGIAHCNFQLRGEASDGDAEFVKNLADQLEVDYHEICFDTEVYAEANQANIQLAARELRYEWLENTRKENGYSAIATAHHLNDLAETIIYNFAKGTGIAGIRGIPFRNGKIIRPLLFTTKQDVLDYVAEKSIAFREDASNATDKYTRNKIRHHLIPILNEINPAFNKSMLDHAMRFKEIEAIYEEGINHYRRKLVKTTRKEVYISIGKLQTITAKKSVLFELIREFGYNNKQVDQILDSLDGQPGKIFFSNTHQLIKDRQFLIISEQTEQGKDHHLIDLSESLQTENFQLDFSVHANAEYEISTAKEVASLSLDKIELPLMLRRWKRGDYFYPFGMNRKKKKLSDFFNDIKLPLHEKEKVWLLCDNQQKIVWVVGHRTDERFRIKENTKEVLRVQLKTD